MEQTKIKELEAAIDAWRESTSNKPVPPEEQKTDGKKVIDNWLYYKKRK